MLTAHFSNGPSSVLAANSSPTPSLDSLNAGMASIAPTPLNGDQNSENGNHSEGSSGMGSLSVVPSAATAAVGNQLSNAIKNPNSVLTNGVQHGVVNRSSSTSSSTSLASSGLGSSPLGGASLPLFGGTGSITSGTHAVVNGAMPGPSAENGSHLPNFPKCSLCCASYIRPKVLHECFHSFCQGCLEKHQEHQERITCPVCHQDSSLNTGGIAGLLSDVGLAGMLSNCQNNDLRAPKAPDAGCTLCKDVTVARCNSCPSNLCTPCLHSHQVTNRYNPHHVVSWGEFNALDGGHDDIKDFQKMINLLNDGQSRVRNMRSNVKTFESAAASLSEHYQKLRTDVNQAFSYYIVLLEDRKMEVMRELEGHFTAKRLALNAYHQRGQEAAEKICQVNEFAERVLRYSSSAEAAAFKQVIEKKLGSVLSACDFSGFKVDDVCDFSFVSEMLSAQSLVRNNFGYVKSRKMVDGRLGASATVGGPVTKQPPISRPKVNIGLNLQSDGSNLFSSLMGTSSNQVSGNGAVTSNVLAQSLTTLAVGSGSRGHQHSSVANGDLHHPDSSSAAPSSNDLLGNGINGIHGECASSSPTLVNGSSSPNFNSSSHPNSASTVTKLQMQLEYQRRQQYSASPNGNGFGSVPGFDVGGLLSKRMGSSTCGSVLNGVADYDRWSNGSNNDGLVAKLQQQQQQQQQCLINGENVAAAVAAYKASLNGAGDGAGLIHDFSNSVMSQMQRSSPMTNSLSSNVIGAIYNNQSHVPATKTQSHIKRQKMIYHCKFGEFGVLEGQFTEPSGVAVNAQNDIIVADTNNHRIQIFDKDGRFKFQFGECGKRDGQLLYPNRVAAVRSSGDIIVTERSPTHQVQIYNQYGQFVRKFGANILQHPRGVCVDDHGRIVVVECKVMRVIIFDQIGNVLNKFGCSKHLEFPNGVVVNDRREIFISDNRAHCVKVFDYEGSFLRQIGGEGLTNYPIGVGINSAGEVTIADNHNNFNLSVFSQSGHLLSALESKVKHAQCFDVALMDDGSVVLASKDYRLYIYRYSQLASIGMC